MPRLPITCVFESGKSFHCSLADAEEIVVSEIGDWDGPHTVRMRAHGPTGGPRSAKVGAYLAEAVRLNKPWAQTMLGQINR